uniref:Uncharacterized protein n=1 Tax=Cucumis melo TaxID=3656 RepID=A0A9I9CUQ4_CUCME
TFLPFLSFSISSISSLSSLISRRPHHHSHLSYPARARSSSYFLYHLKNLHSLSLHLTIRIWRKISCSMASTSSKAKGF